MEVDATETETLLTGPRKVAVVLTAELLVVAAGLGYSLLTDSEGLFRTLVFVTVLLSLATLFLAYRYDSI